MQQSVNNITIPSGPLVAYKRSCHPLTTHSHSETTSVQATSFTAVCDVGNPKPEKQRPKTPVTVGGTSSRQEPALAATVASKWFLTWLLLLSIWRFKLSILFTRFLLILFITQVVL